MKALWKGARIAPSKLIPAARMIRGKKVEEAYCLLSQQIRKSCKFLLKLLNSAIANAFMKGKDKKDLIIQEVSIGIGKCWTMHVFRGRGKVNFLKKQTSNFSISLKEGVKNG